MATLREYEVFTRIAPQPSGRTTEASTGWVDLTLRKGGLSFNPSKVKQDLDSEHRYRGTKHSVFTQRNAEPFTLQTWFFPQSVGTLMHAVADETSGALGYFHVEHYWDATLGGGSPDIGVELVGCVFDGFSFSIERGNTANAIEVDFTGFQNAYEGIPNGSVPTFTGSAIDPYTSTDAYIDFRGDNTSDTWGGDNGSVRRCGVSYSNNTELRNFRGSSTARLNRSWTDHLVQTPTLSVEIEVEVDDDKYLQYAEGADLVEGSLRLAFRHPNADVATTSADTITAGASGTETFTVASATGLAVGDIVFVFDPETSFFTFLPIDAISVNDLDFDRDAYNSYVSMDGSSGGALVVENRAFGMVVPRMVLESMTPPTPNGAVRTMTLTYTASLQSGETRVLIVHAKNDA